MNSIVPIIIVFLFGLSIGSFANVCIYRLPRKKSIANPPRSFCPQCGKTIAWYDNIPVLSFLILRGKCRQCGFHISFRYPLVESLVALLFVGSYLFVVGHQQRLILIPFYWYFCTSLVILSLIDGEHFILPERITYPLIVVGLIFAFLLPEHICYFQWNKTCEVNRLWALAYSAIGLVVGGGSIWLIGIFGKKVFKKEAMGFGDVVLMAGVGAWLGWKMVLLSIFLGALVALICYIPLLIVRKAEWDSELPFGPYLAAGALLSLFFGWGILSWYLDYIIPK